MALTVGNRVVEGATFFYPVLASRTLGTSAPQYPEYPQHYMKIMVNSCRVALADALLLYAATGATPSACPNRFLAGQSWFRHFPCNGLADQNSCYALSTAETSQEEGQLTRQGACILIDSFIIVVIHE